MKIKNQDKIYKQDNIQMDPNIKEIFIMIKDKEKEYITIQTVINT